MLSVNVKAAFEIAPLSLRVRSACPVDLWGQKELGPVKPHNPRALLSLATSYIPAGSMQ